MLAGPLRPLPRAPWLSCNATWRCGHSVARAAPSACWSVHIWKTPLVGLESLGALLGGAYPGLFEHAVVLVSSCDTSALALDFLPARPTSPGTALQLLSPAGTPGALRARRLSLRPRRRTWLVGSVRPELLGECGADVDTEAQLQAQLARWHAQGGWDTARVRVGARDCTHYATALCLWLTGTAHALQLDPRALEKTTRTG